MKCLIIIATSIMFSSCIYAQQVINPYINVKDDYGNTGLYYAAQDGNIFQIKQLLSIGALVNSQNAVGHTPLFAAVNFGDINKKNEVIKILLDNGADVTLDNDENGNLLDSIWCNYEAYKLLLKKGIRPSQKFLNALNDRISGLNIRVKRELSTIEIDGVIHCVNDLDKDGYYKAELADLKEMKQLCNANLKANTQK